MKSLYLRKLIGVSLIYCFNTSLILYLFSLVHASEIISTSSEKFVTNVPNGLQIVTSSLIEAINDGNSSKLKQLMHLPEKQDAPRVRVDEATRKAPPAQLRKTKDITRISDRVYILRYDLNDASVNDDTPAAVWFLEKEEWVLKRYNLKYRDALKLSKSLLK